MKNIAILLSVIFITVGCYKDKTKFGNNEISEIKYEMINDIYELDKWEILKIAPKLSQTIEKEMKYEWQVGYKIVSTEPVLEYECDEVGQFTVRLRAYNEDGSTFILFRLTVNSPYQTGLVVLSRYENNDIVSFRRTYISDSITRTKKTMINCLAKENPHISKEELGQFGNVGLSDSNDLSCLYFATKNPDKFLRVNANTFKATNFIEPKFNNISSIHSSEGSLLLTYGGDKVLEYFTARDNAFFGGINKSISALKLPNVTIDPVATYIYDEYGSTTALVFDDTNEQLIKYASPTIIIEKDNFKGLRPHSFTPCDKSGNAILMFKDKNGKFKLFHYVAKTDAIQNVVDFSSTDTYVNSSVATAPNSIETNILYSDGANKIYRFNYAAKNIPTEPFIELPSNYVIKSLILNDVSNRKLYVLAANTTTTSKYKSAIFCFSYLTKELVWSEEGVGGDPINMILK